MLLFWSCMQALPPADQRQEAILSRWPEDPVAATELIDALPDPVEVVAVITLLTEAHPGETRALCQRLDGDARRRCRRLNQRPHLTAEIPLPAQARTASGPSTVHILPDIPDPLADVSALPAAQCSDAVEPRSCRSHLATEAAKAGDIRAAVGLCRGMHGALRWKHECAFQAAEKVINTMRFDRLEAAGEACMAAGDFAAHCLAHLTATLSRQAPPASSPITKPWQEVIEIAAHLDTYWSPQDPQFAEWAIARLWAEVMFLSYARSPRVVGNPLDHLPPAARPHIHAAAAIRLLHLSRDRSGSLADWQGRLADALAARVEAPLPLSGQPMALVPVDYWPADRPGDEHIPATFAPGNIRRPTSDDIATDQTLALLEAAARCDPPLEGLLVEAAASSDEMIQWSARRLRAAVMLQSTGGRSLDLRTQ
ncbi:MAG: hypothetical protein P8R54_28880 [Myxococcota bacterium]|nr:hypothetical protein [Myxococcota bacterium]